MATPTLKDSGTQTATEDTRHVLKSLSTAGYYKLWVELLSLSPGASANQGADEVELSVEKKILSTGSLLQSHSATYVGGLVLEKNVFSLWYELATGEQIDFILRQTNASAGRQYPWAIYSG